ncbi:MAG: SpaA isopeptide-forming pilin-related protein, partial [Ethanoligenens sp.]
TPSPNYITKSGSASEVNGKQQITWTIPFNNDGGTLQNVVITDPYINNGTAAPAGSQIMSVKYYATAAGVASATSIGTDSSSTPYYTDNNGVLTVNFGNVTGAHTLVFTVQFPDNYLQTNQDGSFTNTATLKADNNAYLQGGVPATNGTGVGTGNTMLSKSGSPDYTSGEINWTVKVNESKRAMAAAQLKDVIGDNHNYVPGTFKVIDNTTSEQVFKDSSTVSIGTDINDVNFSYTASTKTLLYTFPTAKSDQYTVTYSTKLDSSQNQVYAGNTSGSYSNTATLTPDINTPSVSTTVNPPQSYATNVLSKSGPGFNYINHELSWNIKVNSAQYPLTNVVVTDALTDDSLKSPNQQVGDPEYAFDFDANQPVTVTTGSTQVTLTADTTGTPGAGQYYYNGSTRTLTFNLGDLSDSTPANRTKTINFQMKLMDSVDHYFATNSSNKLNNTATVKSNENTNPTSAQGSQTIDNTVIGKGAVYTNNNKYIDWNVQIDQNGANIGSGVALADTLQSGLLLDTSSVKLYPQTQAADGSMTPSGSRDQNGLLQNPSTPVTLSGANVAYDVSTNKFVFTMPKGNVSTPYLLTFRTYIDTTVITNNTTVNNTITLSGSTAATEDSQNASTTYTQNAGGYATGVTGQITLKKTDRANGKVLAGAQFRLYDQYKNHLRDVTTGVDGTVTLPYLAYSIPYRLVETGAPTGYDNNNSTDYWFEYINDGSNTGHIQQITSATDTTAIGSPTASSGSPVLTFSDAMKTATVQFTKQGDGGTGLAGVQFTLIGTALNGTAVSLTSNTTDSNGLVTFGNVPYSDANGYTITETQIPAGYTAVAPLARVMVSDNTVASGTYTLPNQTDGPAGSLTVTKADADGNGTLEGAVFQLFTGGNANTSGAPAYTSGVTGTNGQAVFTGIPAGTYTLHESTAPTGYMAAPDKNVTIDSNATASVRLSTATTVSDQRQTGSISFTKTDGATPLAGAQFAAYYDQAGNYPVKVNGKVVVSTGSDNTSALTLADGVVKFANFPYATDAANGYSSGFWVREVVIPANYAAAAPFQVALTSAGSNAPTTVADTLKTANVQFNKTDGVNALDGATFGLYTDAAMSKSIATVTSIGGAVTFGNVPYSDNAYYVKELNTPDDVHYQKAASFFFTLNDNNTSVSNGVLRLTSANTVGIGAAATPVDANGNVVDTPLGSITVQKQDAQTSAPLAGAVFQVKSAYDGKIYTAYTTNADGSVTFGNLPLNPDAAKQTSFTVIETTAPQNYEQNTYSGKNLTVSLQNAAGKRDSVLTPYLDTKKAGTINLTKVDQNNQPLAGAEFTLFQTVNGVEQTVQGPVISNSSGLVQFTGVPYGSYYIRETKVPADYTGDTAKQIPVVLDDQNPSCTIVTN